MTVSQRRALHLPWKPVTTAYMPGPHWHPREDPRPPRPGAPWPARPRAAGTCHGPREGPRLTAAETGAHGRSGPGPRCPGRDTPLVPGPPAGGQGRPPHAAALEDADPRKRPRISVRHSALFATGQAARLSASVPGTSETRDRHFFGHVSQPAISGPIGADHTPTAHQGSGERSEQRARQHKRVGTAPGRGALLPKGGGASLAGDQPAGPGGRTARCGPGGRAPAPRLPEAPAPGPGARTLRSCPTQQPQSSARARPPSSQGSPTAFAGGPSRWCLVSAAPSSTA